MLGAFAFEELEVWQRAVAFADRVIELAENLNTNQKHFRLIEQLESAVTSIPMNVAEGKGRYSKKGIRPFPVYRQRIALRNCDTIEDLPET